MAGCGSPGSAAQQAGTEVPGAPGTTAIGAQLFPVSQRHALPAIVGQTLTGQRLALQSLTGHRVVVVNVWASWCTNCRAESAALAKLAAEEAPGVQFVGLDEQDTASKARKFVADIGTSYPQLIDADGSTLNRLTLLPRDGIPSTLIVDRHGDMAARIIGQVTGPQLHKLIREVTVKTS